MVTSMDRLRELSARLPQVPAIGLRQLRFAFGHSPPTLGSVCARVAEIHGERVAFTEPSPEETAELVLSYGDVAALVDRWAGFFAERIQPGERVVLATPNGVEQLLAVFAVSRAGGIPAPVNPHMTATEVEHVIADTGAQLVIRSFAQLAVDGVRGLGSDLGGEDPDAVAALFYTSGTTGKPKGAALTHRALLGQLSRFGLIPSPILDPMGNGFEVLLALPVAHIMGFIAATGALIGGLQARSLRRFNPVVVLDEIEGRRINAFVGVPSMYRMLDAAGAESRDLGSVRVWISGADVMPPALAAKFKRMGSSVRLPVVGDVGEAMFVEGYGMVETGGGAMAKLSPPFLPLGLGSSLGFAMPGYRFRVVDEEGSEVGFGQEGELQLQGPGVLSGYWGDAAATDGVMTGDGWLRTGDQVVQRGPLGFAFQGRSKNVLKVGGYSVYPPEIESVVEEHPSVVAAAVVGVPDEQLGEVPWAAVVLREGSRTKPDTIRVWAEKRLADYKTPRRVVVVDSLPQTGTGKVQRARVRQLLGVE